MDRNLAYAGVSVVLAALLGFSWGQGQGGLAADEPKPMTHDVAVVDMVKVFEKHKGFLAKSEDFRRDGQEVQEELKRMFAAGNKLQEELKRAKPGSADQARLQQELNEKTAEYQKYQKEQMERLQKEQNQTIKETYEQISAEIRRIAEERGLKLVLRFQEENLDMRFPQKVIETVNRQVLYQNGLDITEEVLQALN
jgi:Skp family chaperone for outer membrane proteins